MKDRKNKIVKLILHYLGEIIIVIIGIFIAFQLNNYKEKKNAVINRDKSFKRILVDLNKEKSWILNKKKGCKENKEKLKSIIYMNNKSILDSLYYYSNYYFNHFNFGTEYTALKLSGELNLIQNEKLRYDLVSYYELSHSFYKNIENTHKDFVNNELMRYLDKIFEADSSYLYNSKNVEKELKSVELRKLLKKQISFYENIEKYINPKKVENLITAIESEL